METWFNSILRSNSVKMKKKTEIIIYAFMHLWTEKLEGQPFK